MTEEQLQSNGECDGAGNHGVDSGKTLADNTSPFEPSTHRNVVIVGAGLSGICIAIKLLRAGIADFTILEKADEIGGTWRDNRYPGLVCDIPARYYRFSFEPNPHWSRFMAPREEIQQYLLDVTDRYGIRPHIRFGAEVTRAEFTGRNWRIKTTAGEVVTADFFIAASGVLHHPVIPDFPGRDDFAGTAMHSAEWQDDVDLHDKRVGLVGTGSTGVQIATAIAAKVRHLTVFQRTAPWIYPTPNLRYRFGRLLANRLPPIERLSYKFWQAYMELIFAPAIIRPGWQRRLLDTVIRLNLRSVRDPNLRKKLTPDYEPMCKRLVATRWFYREIQRPNVSLITDAVDRIEPAGVRCADGRLHELDVLIFATGFDAHAYMRPMELVGENGVRLQDLWKDGAWCYRSVSLPRFPNFFIMIGPHSPFGNQSNFTIAETIADYIIKSIQLVRDSGATMISPTQDAAERYQAEIAAAMPSTIWVTGCKSWYLGSEGGSPVLFPWLPKKHREMLAEPDLGELELRSAPVSTGTPSAPREG